MITFAAIANNRATSDSCQGWKSSIIFLRLCTLALKVRAPWKYLLLLFIVSASYFDTGILYAADDPGTLPGSLDVTPQGTATYTIPIQCPPGTAGMTPVLTLT